MTARPQPPQRKLKLERCAECKGKGFIVEWSVSFGKIEHRCSNCDGRGFNSFFLEADMEKPQ